MKILNEDIYKILKASLEKFFPYIEELNRINYFPVADYDTGTNMYETLKDTIINSKHLSDIPKVASIYSKGNSGIIFSQILSGLMTSFIQTNGIHKYSDIKRSLILANEYAYNAVLYPKEGTMLTFIRILSESSSMHNIKSNLDRALLTCVCDDIIDAGAKGLYYFFCVVCNIKPNKKLLLRYSREQNLIEKPTNKYCTEFIIKNSQVINKKDLINKIDSYGDSINLVFLDETIKIHIHTNVPFKIFRLFPELIQWYKIDNMLLSQHKSPFAVIVDINKDEDVFKDVDCEYIITSSDDVSSLNYKIKTINYTDTFILITDHPERFTMLHHNFYIVKTRGFQSRYAACLCINTWMPIEDMIENMRLSVETYNL